MPSPQKIIASKFYVPKPASINRYQGLTDKIEEGLLIAGQKPPGNAISWKDIEDYDRILPEYQEVAEQLIQRLLGYLPMQSVQFPQEIFIRKEMDSFLKGEIPQQEFEDNVYRLIMHIRNLDMEKGGWCDKWVYDQDDLDRYMYNYAPYISRARDRLFLFFEEYPDLIYSLDAELYLRHCMCRFNLDTRDKLTSAFDYKVLTIITYRKAMHLEGKAAADAMYLLGK